MGFTGVVWEARSTEQLARDLTTGPGPGSLGEAGASWVRVANAYSSAADDYKKLLDQISSSWQSEGSESVVTRLESLGEWLAATALNAAANGQRAEEVAVANTVAILAMPTVSEVVEAKASHDMMSSLAAYNGAVLTGTFAEFDAAAASEQASAAAVMEQYESAAESLATPWEEPLPPDVTNGEALKAEKAAKEAARSGGGRGGGGGAGAAPRQLSPWVGQPVKSSGESKAIKPVSFTSASGGTSGMGGGGYGPMGGMGARGNNENREHESVSPAAPLAGGGEASASESGPDTWLPATQQNDAPFTVSNVSWGANTAIFDELVAPVESNEPVFEDEPERALEKVSDRWVAPPVIGGDRESV
jgi:hypothetical protein